jgi:excisionase family DNA binding protein
VVTPPLMTAAQLATALSVSKATIYRWANEGHFPSLRLGPGVIRFDPVAVRAWLDALAHHPPDEPTDATP